MTKPKIKENDTFRFGENYHLNACVGKNGYVDLYRYQDGYIEAVKELLSGIRRADFNPDSMVYPILYSARHAIELFFKHQLHQLYIIEEKVTGRSQVIRMNTHMLDDLYSELKRLTEFDSRFEEEVDRLNEYIQDYVDVDNNGEAFRYPYSNQGDQHLEQLYCVNLQVFRSRFLELCEVLDNLGFLTEFICNEYSTGSVVGAVSRDVIEQISKQLPSREDWVKPEFDAVKNKVMEKYGISSCTFSKVLNLIQSHYEFASNIGVELPLKTLTTEELRAYLDIYNIFEDRKTESFMKYKVEATDQIVQSIRKEAIASLAALRAFAYQDGYTEGYDHLYKYFNTNDTEDIVFNNLIGFGPVHHRLRASLQRLGQITLLEELSKDNH